MTGIYMDSEFTGLHRNTSLISIGLVSDTGSSFYAEFTDYDKSQVDGWIQENVISHLSLEPGTWKRDEINGSTIVTACDNSSNIRSRLLKWLENEWVLTDRKLQFFVDCYAYDWVLLVDLLTGGKSALDMPEYIYYIPIDLSTVLWSMMEDPDIGREEFCSWNYHEKDNSVKHSAYGDALVIEKCFDRIKRYKLPNKSSLIYI